MSASEAAAGPAAVKRKEKAYNLKIILTTDMCTEIVYRFVKTTGRFYNLRLYVQLFSTEIILL